MFNECKHFFVSNTYWLLALEETRLLNSAEIGIDTNLSIASFNSSIWQRAYNLYMNNQFMIANTCKYIVHSVVPWISESSSRLSFLFAINTFFSICEIIELHSENKWTMELWNIFDKFNIVLIILFFFSVKPTKVGTCFRHEHFLVLHFSHNLDGFNKLDFFLNFFVPVKFQNKVLILWKNKPNWSSDKVITLLRVTRWTKYFFLRE